MPGGGASGEVILPSYTIAQHSKWLNNNLPTAGLLGLTTPADTEYATYATTIGNLVQFDVHTEMLAAAALNPFTGVAAYDPGPVFSDVEDQLTEWRDLVADLDPTEQLALAVDAALAHVDDDIHSTTAIAEASAAHEARTEEPYRRAVASQLATLLGGRAVMSSGFDSAMALMNNARQAELADYSAKLGLASYDQRTTATLQITQLFINLLNLQQTTNQAVSGLTYDIGKGRIVAMQDQQNIDLSYDENEARWRPSMFEYGSQVISSYSGASPVPRPMSKGERALSAIGNAISTAIGLGTTLGNPVAGIAGGIGYLALAATTQNWR